MAEGISGWVTRRTALEIQSEDERLVRYLEVMQDELAAERSAAAVRLAAAMAELEAQDWTPEKARAALSLPEPRKPAAA
jgi:acetone carboxylase gamma subunit